MKKIISILTSAIFVFMFVSSVSAKGFDQYGYNDTARVFNGTCLSWHMGKFSSTEAQAMAYCGDWSNDKLVMKWNAEWDRGNAEGWTDPNGYTGAWTSNEWNGMNGGSGEVWHYKIRWYGACTEGELLPSGGRCIWGQFETVMDQGVSGGEHIWLTKATPNGYGVKP